MAYEARKHERDYGKFSWSANCSPSRQDTLTGYTPINDLHVEMKHGGLLSKVIKRRRSVYIPTETKQNGIERSRTKPVQTISEGTAVISIGRGESNRIKDQTEQRCHERPNRVTAGVDASHGQFYEIVFNRNMEHLFKQNNKAVWQSRNTVRLYK